MKEAMKLALEALEQMYCCYANPKFISHKQQEGQIIEQTKDAMASLRQAIEQAQKQEPVAWMRKDETCTDCFVWEKTEDHTIPLYTSPQQRQPLMDEQADQIIKGLRTCQHQTSKREFLKVWLRDWAAHGITGEQK